jgi:mono/diheme cytochrome c family protein
MTQLRHPRVLYCDGRLYLRSVPAAASTDLPATLAPPAPASHRDGGTTPDPRGKMVFEGACVSCHGWTGESPISPFATLATETKAASDVTRVPIK